MPVLAFFEQNRETTLKLAEQYLWKMDVVVEYVVNCLKVARVPAEAQIGADARFIYMPILMLPKWLGEYLLGKSVPRPVPAVMQENK